MELPREMTATKGCPSAATHDRQARAGVAAGQLDHRLTRPQVAVCPSLANDLKRDPVFLAAAGAQVLQLDQ